MEEYTLLLCLTHYSSQYCNEKDKMTKHNYENKRLSNTNPIKKKLVILSGVSKGELILLHMLHLTGCSCKRKWIGLCVTLLIFYPKNQTTVLLLLDPTTYRNIILLYNLVLHWYM